MSTSTELSTHVPAPAPCAEPVAATARASLWMRAWWWDVAFIHFGWVPFYSWMVAGPLGGSPAAPSWPVALATAFTVTVALNFVHRHYVFALVYGDPQKLAERRRAFLVAPIVMFSVVGGVVALGSARTVGLFFAVAAMWNVWHVVQQRYGFLRMYAGKAGGGLESRPQAARDFRVVWSYVVCLALALPIARPSAFEGLGGIGPAGKLFQAFAPFGASTAGRLSLLALGVVLAVVTVDWVRHERASRVAWRDLVPRWTFAASTLGLLGVFFVSGPVVGLLCFGFAHSIEYVAFVHHFGEKKYGGPGAPPTFARWLFRSMWRAPLVLLPLLAFFAFLGRYKGAIAFTVYITSASMLHYLFDGWIWKLRKNAVASPLGIRASGR